MKAIETRYHGYCFRSRLEARWAVFFDALAAAWEYEPQGYNLDDAGPYLPDFFLRYATHHDADRAAGNWVEIKAVDPSGDELRKMVALSQVTKHSGRLFAGLPCQGAPWCTHRGQAQARRADPIYPLDVWVDYWARFSPLEVDGHGILAAANQARAARFEFGQSGPGA